MNKMPDGEVWAIRNEDENSLNYGKTMIFDFTGIAREDLVELLKSYVWHQYRSRNMDLYVLLKTVRDIKRTFHPFLVVNQTEHIKDLTVSDIERFQTYLNMLLTNTKKAYSKSSLEGFYGAARGLLLYGKIHRKDLVPEEELYTGSRYTRGGRKVRIEYVPDEIMIQVNDALDKEENVYLKNVITIIKFTGMRLGELSALKIDCLREHLINGYMLQWMDYKNHKERAPIPVRAECANAIYELLQYTEEIRNEAEGEVKDYLFIRKTTFGISRISRGVIGRWIHYFPANHAIRGSDGQIYGLTSHQFRRTLATDMLSHGVNISVIQNVLGHATPVTTSKYYADVKDKQRIEMFHTIGIIGNIRSIDESIIDASDDLEWFKENAETAARMCDGYCTRPVRNGEICDRLLKRQKCLTCSRFITTPEYLAAHRQHLTDLEKELEENVFGEHYAAHLVPTVEALREIVQKLEEMTYATE